MDLDRYLLSKQPLLKKRLRVAKIDDSPSQYVLKSFKSALSLAGFFALASFFMFSSDSPNILIPIVVFLISAKMFYSLNLKKVDVAINKRARAIDKDVLFAGRFLLVKLNSGKPLVNAIEEAAQGDGAATSYFKDIIKDLELGTPLESALERATEYCPSESLKKILFQITNALKIGVDVTNFLQAILDEIADEQLTQIVRYGKKLSSLTMFYMLGAVIVPSLGMTMFIVIASMISININMTMFGIAIGVLAFIQFIFITLFRSARPNMEV